MKLFSTILIITLLLLVNSEQLKSQDNINNADNIFYGLNLNEATELYQKILQNNQASADEKVLAYRKLAYIEFHFNSNLDSARILLNHASKLSEYQAYVFKDLIKYETLSKNFEEAKKAYKQAQLLLKPDNNIQLVTIEYSDMILCEAFEKIENKLPLDTLLLNNALQKIEIVNKSKPGILKPAKVQLGISLLLENGQKAFDAWCLYYNTSDNQKAEGLLSEPYEYLLETLPKWNKNSLNNKNREKLILSLAVSRFYELAYYMNLYLPKTTSDENSEITDISNYYKFCKQIEKSMSQYYLDIALSGKNNIRKVKKDVNSIQKHFWQKLNKNEEKKYTKNRFIEELYKKFGTKIYSGTFAGNYFFIGGHTIIDSVKTVEQYGYKAEIQFVVLDTRFSNNYWGWFTGYYGFSGYANGEIIARYREPVASNPINYWEKLNNKKLLLDWRKQVAKLTKQDDSLSTATPNESLMGLYERIRLNTYTEILDSLRATSLKEKDLRQEFISILNQIEYTHIINHEGRHAIDFNTLSKIELQNNAELEFRATLSQIYFSQYPLLDIRFEINNTPHGLANKKLLKIISDWMEQNKDEIKSFDKNRPTLPQMDLLTNKQIRDIIEFVEPFLKEE